MLDLDCIWTGGGVRDACRELHIPALRAHLIVLRPARASSANLSSCTPLPCSIASPYDGLQPDSERAEFAQHDERKQRFTQRLQARGCRPRMAMIKKPIMGYHNIPEYTIIHKNIPEHTIIYHRDWSISERGCIASLMATAWTVRFAVSVASSYWWLLGNMVI